MHDKCLLSSVDFVTRGKKDEEDPNKIKTILFIYDFNYHFNQGNL